MRWRWTGQSRAAFERQYLTDSFYLYHSFSVIVAQPLSSTFGGQNCLSVTKIEQCHPDEPRILWIKG